MKIEDIIKSEHLLPIEKRTILNIFYTHQIVAEKFSELLKQYDISTEQFNVLRILRGQKGKPANMSLIQDRMIAKTSNTTRLVDKLLLKNLVYREVCEHNRRKMEVTITQKGLDLLTVLDPEVVKHEQAFAANLSTVELEQLNLLLEKFRTLI
jgi:DNA-binding MarR family transcriptional regulator